MIARTVTAVVRAVVKLLEGPPPHPGEIPTGALHRGLHRRPDSQAHGTRVPEG